VLSKAHRCTKFFSIPNSKREMRYLAVTPHSVHRSGWLAAPVGGKQATQMREPRIFPFFYSPRQAETQEMPLLIK
jgi:hypothetical protein